MAKCTGIRCPMQYGYEVDKCEHKDCPYRTEPITNADRIRAMTDDELAEFLCEVNGCYQENCPGAKLCEFQGGKANGLKKWLQQPAEGD